MIVTPSQPAGDAARARHDDAGRAGGRGLRREVETVDALAREREEELAGRDGAAVVVRAREVRPARPRLHDRAAHRARRPVERRRARVAVRSCAGRRGRHEPLPARPPPPRGRRSGAWWCRRSGSPRGPCRRSAGRRPTRAAAAATRIAARRSTSAWYPRVARPSSPAASFGALVRRTPSRTMSTIAAGSSVRGLSDVTIARSASRAAISPIIGRLPRSRSPPQPNTTISRRGGHRAHRRDGALQPVGRVRVVDDAQHAAIVGDLLEAPRDRDVRGAARDRVGVQPARDRHADGDRQVLEVVVADQRRVDLDPPSGVAKVARVP